jgi:hypothetical protein
MTVCVISLLCGYKQLEIKQWNRLVSNPKQVEKRVNVTITISVCTSVRSVVMRVCGSVENCH